MTASGMPKSSHEPIPPESDQAPVNTSAPANGEETEALDSVTDLTGQTLAHFRVEQRLGGGAMGSVYRAYDTKAERVVALKVLLPGADAVMRERFRREARTASTLKHPHIVRTHQVGQTSPDGVFYIAMELVEGASLGKLLDRHGRLEPAAASALLSPIADALAYAHAQGVVHRDVKPSNILLRRAAPNTPGSVQLGALPYPVVPLLSDFGIARALDAPELTSAGRTIGTPAFMAPEQCAGTGDIDGRADIYSLGAVFYRCLIGKAPFSGSTTQILHAHVYDPVMIPEDVAQQLPAPVLGVLTRSMMKDPSQRYATMDMMAEELSRCAAIPQDGHADDATMTMATLPATPLVHSTPARILVPATPLTPRGLGVVPLRPAPSATEVRPVNPPPAEPARRRLPGKYTGAMILGAALIVLLLLLSVTLFSSLLPSLSVFSRGNQPQETPVATTQPVADDGNQAPPAAAVGSSDKPSQTQSGLAMLASPELTRTPRLTPTPTPAPPPAIPLESAWADAQSFFDDRDWKSALDWLLIVQRIDPEFEATQVASMLVTSYLGLATEATAAGDLDEAVANLESALALDAESELVQEMHDATVALVEAETDERAEAQRTLRAIHVDYAETLLARDPCAAAAQIDAAIQILSDPALTAQQDEYQQACSGQQTAQELSQLSGSIVYSAQVDGTYRIFSMPVGDDSASTLLVNNATQPSLSPNGRMLSFYSTRPEAQGLYGLDLWAGLSADDRSLRFTNAPEDARDTPASWNSQGDRLAFTSTRYGDGRYRIYFTWANSDEAVDTLGYGKDPAWHPHQDLVVYNGTDENGNAPGLWLAAADGSSRIRLTDNGNDQRPVWTPDGEDVVFMSNGRDGNWELYRVNLADRSIVRLTSHPAQDGLPAISPDGRTVAFMSDRDGYWRIWYVPIDGGEAKPLGRINGELPKWLEYAIQWVP